MFGVGVVGRVLLLEYGTALGQFLDSAHFSRKSVRVTEVLLVLDLCDLVQDAGAEPVWARAGSLVRNRVVSIYICEEPCRQYIYMLPCDMYV